MDYKLNVGQWDSIFAIPKSVVDKHIKLVGSTQLKVLLWVLRHLDENHSVESISKSLFIHQGDVKEALQYWIKSGILMSRGLEPEGDSNKCGENLKETATEVSGFPKTDGEYIANRVEGCEDIAFVIKDSEFHTDLRENDIV